MLIWLLLNDEHLSTIKLIRSVSSQRLDKLIYPLVSDEWETWVKMWSFSALDRNIWELLISFYQVHYIKSVLCVWSWPSWWFLMIVFVKCLQCPKFLISCWFFLCSKGELRQRKVGPLVVLPLFFLFTPRTVFNSFENGCTSTLKNLHKF